MDVSSTVEGSEASDDSGIWMSVLKCYVCDDLFKKPRVLPCGHTFCSECLLSLRDEAALEFKRNNKIASVRKGESGLMACPYPHCEYTIRVMNLTRWATKNRAAAQAAGMVRRRSHEVKDPIITNNRNLTQHIAESSVGEFLGLTKLTKGSTPEADDHMADFVYRMDPLRKAHLSQSNKIQSWRSWVALMGIDLFGEMFSLSF